MPYTKLIAQKLVKNQEDTGNAIKPFYGNEAGNKSTNLLKGHIMGAVEILQYASWL